MFFVFRGPYLDKKGLAYVWEKIKNYLKYRNIVPEQSKTYTGVLGTANNWSGATFFFGSIRPTGWYDLWKIKYKIHTYVPGKNAYDMVAEVMISGEQGNMRAYSSMNTVAAYYPAYNHELYRLKSAGYTNGFGHSLGVRFYSAYSPTTAGYERTIEVEILETENCEFTFYDSCLPYASIPGTGSTNYDNYTEMNYVTNGLQETSDSNDVNYQNRIYYSSTTAAAQIYRYQLLLRTRDGQAVPVSSANNTFTTGKTYSSIPFDPFGEIYYWNTTSAPAAGANLANAAMYRQILADLRYAFDLDATDAHKLTARLPVYLTATPQADGTAVLTKPTGSVIGPLTQSLPTSEDGLIYIYLGQAYEDSKPYRLELTLSHPVYWYKNGAVREYSPSVNGHTVNSDVPANAKFTDTTYEEASTTAAGLMSASDKSKLNDIDDGAEANQNAYGKVWAYNTDGNVLYSDTANAKTDTMVLLEGTNVELSSEAMYLGGEYVNALKISANDPAYDTMTQAQANAGTSTDGKLISPKVLNDTITGKVGTNFTETSGSTVSAANNAWTKVQSVTLAAGTYLVKFGVSFASNATGYRSICLTVGSETATLDRYAPTQNAVSGRATDMMDTEVVVLTAQTTVNVHAFHTAGTALNTYPFIKTLKIK